MKKFKVKFMEESGTRGKDGFYVTEKTLYVSLGDNARKEDVLNEIIRRGYRGEVINIEEDKNGKS